MSDVKWEDIGVWKKSEDVDKDTEGLLINKRGDVAIPGQLDYVNTYDMKTDSYPSEEEIPTAPAYWKLILADNSELMDMIKKVKGVRDMDSADFMKLAMHVQLKNILGKDRGEKVKAVVEEYMKGHGAGLPASMVALDDFSELLGKGKVCLTKAQFIKEHRHLVKLLGKVGKEGRDQEKELRKVLRQT